MAKSNGSGRKRILVVSRSAFGAQMSSPGIRTRHMVEVLAQELPEAEITLALQKGSDPPDDPSRLPYSVAYYNWRSLLALMMQHDIIIANDYPPHAIAAFPWKTFVLDYYTVYFLEWMEQSRDHLRKNKRYRETYMAGARRRVGAELVSADYISVANDRQRDYYIGALIALGLIDPIAYDDDPSLKRMIGVAPHGIRPDPLGPKGKPALKGVYAGIKETDRLIMWNGGILQWYDPITLLQAMAKVREERDDIKLVFVGGAYPGLQGMGLGLRYMESLKLANELGLYNNTVFFDMAWVPYERMKDYMLEADLAVCTYFNNLETHFSLRTRFVDVFWAEVPLICTEGDVLAGMVREKRMGEAVPQQDVDAVAGAILRLLGDPDYYEECRRNIREANKEMSWTVALRDLVEFCRDPRTSALPKWKRTAMLAGAWAQWAAQRAVGVVLSQ